MKTKLIAGGLLVVAGAAVTLTVRSMPGGAIGQPGQKAEAATQKTATLPQAEKPRFVRQIDQITDPGLHWEVRVQAVRALPGKLGEDSTERLFEFLEQPPASGQENWYLVCNEIMEVLRKRNLVPGIYTRKHLELIRSANADPMIRDYAAQHLAQWISGIDPTARETDPAAVKEAFDTMCAEASNPANGQLTLVGTTLNALTDAALHGDQTLGSRQEELARLAMTVLEDPSSSISSVNRSSALQAAARLNAPGLAETCRKLAADTAQPADVRLSSIAALGQVGGPDDLAALRSYTNDPAFKFAAAAAVTRLQAASAAR